MFNISYDLHNECSTSPPPLSPSLQPALSAYQQRLHHEIHGPEEPLPDALSIRLKSGTVQPLRASSTSPLPELPGALLEKQRSLSVLRRATNKARVQLSPPLLEDSSGRPLPPAAGQPPSGKSSQRRRSQAAISRRRSATSALLLNSDPDSVLTRYNVHTHGHTCSTYM